MCYCAPAGGIFIDNINLECDAGWTIFANDARRFQSLERPPYMPRFSTAAELVTYAHRAGFENVQCHHQSPLVILDCCETSAYVKRGAGSADARFRSNQQLTCCQATPVHSSLHACCLDFQ